MRLVSQKERSLANKEQTFLNLLDLIYDAASNPQLWPTFMGKLDEITDGALLPTFSKDICAESLSSNVTVLRPKQNPIPPSETFELARKLAPHIQRAITIHRLISTLERDREVLSHTLDRLAVGIALLGDDGNVLYLNRSARLILEEKAASVIRLHNGRLSVHHSDKEDAFQRLVFRAISGSKAGSEAGGGTLVLSGGLGKPTLFIMATSLPMKQYLIRRENAAAAIFLSDPEKGIQSPIEVLRELYGLTPSEAQVVSLLIQGKKVKEAAAELAITSNTARTHLKRAFYKTETTRQGDLIRLLLSGPATLRLN